jgi:hypothetical protein
MADQRPIGYWLKTVDRLIDERFAETLEEHGVTRRQWQLLEALTGGPRTAAELDEAVAPFLRGDAEESAGEQLGELVESGWVEADAASCRLTERGATAHARLADVVAQNRAAATEGVSPEEYAATVSVLERVARNLGWSG